MILYVAKDLRSIELPDYGMPSAYPPSIWVRFEGDRDVTATWLLTAALLAHIWRQVPAIEKKLADDKLAPPSKREEVYRRFTRIMDVAEASRMFKPGEVYRELMKQRRKPYVMPAPPPTTFSPQLGLFLAESRNEEVLV